MEFRPIFLAKSHLYLPNFDDFPKQAAKDGCMFCFGQGRPLELDVTTFPNGQGLAIHICSHHKIITAFAVEVTELQRGCQRCLSGSSQAV